MPVASRVLAENPDLDFEVVAQGRLAAGWRRIDRVTVLPQLPWPEYRQATANRAVDIMLASLLPTRVNAARAPTTRSGAALLVSDPEVYAPSQEERALGMLVDLDPDRWVRAIADPVRDPDRIRELARLNRAHVAAAQATAPPLFVEHNESGSLLWRFCEH
jgi:hypothetical protein